VNASDAGIDCPGPDEAFVTSCSGSETEGFDDSDLVKEVLEDLVNEVLEDSKENDPPTRKAYNSRASSADINDDGQDDTEGSTSIHQLKQTTKKLIHRYYDPLPRNGKCAIGSICGFTASRLSLGVANRVFRLAGATWVLSEMLHATGYCDDAKCVPEEARPWIRILRRALIKQSAKVRMIARRIWDKDRIREIAEKDERVAGGFAVGAFIGFVV